MPKENTHINAVNNHRKRSVPIDSQSMNPQKILKYEDERRQQNKEMTQRSGGVQRYLVAVEYIGTNFVGFQKQPKGRTVQGVLEDAFSKFIGQTVSSACSSRTDAGVHALANVCHVDVERISKRKPGEVLPPHGPGVVKSAVNHFLQKNAGDMSVVDVRCVPINFHARFRAQERTYYYRILSGKEPLSTFERDRSWHVPEDLNLSLMEEACKVLVGHHDFSSFRASGCQAKSPIKTLTELHVHEIAAWPAFPSSIDRNSRADVPDKKHTHLSCEGKASLDKPVQREGDISLSREQPMEHKMPVSHCQEDHKDYKGEGLHFGRRRGHRGYVVTARAPSFLYHQVRLLVGALKCVGTGKLSIEDVEIILKAQTITVAPPMAPAHGLYLAEVKYDFSSNGGNQIEDDGE